MQPDPTLETPTGVCLTIHNPMQNDSSVNSSIPFLRSSQLGITNQGSDGCQFHTPFANSAYDYETPGEHEEAFHTPLGTVSHPAFATSSCKGALLGSNSPAFSAGSRCGAVQVLAFAVAEPTQLCKHAEPGEGREVEAAGGGKQSEAISRSTPASGQEAMQASGPAPVLSPASTAGGSFITQDHPSTVASVTTAASVQPSQQAVSTLLAPSVTHSPCTSVTSGAPPRDAAAAPTPAMSWERTLGSHAPAQASNAECAGPMDEPGASEGPTGPIGASATRSAHLEPTHAPSAIVAAESAARPVAQPSSGKGQPGSKQKTPAAQLSSAAGHVRQSSGAQALASFGHGPTTTDGEAVSGRHSGPSRQHGSSVGKTTGSTGRIAGAAAKDPAAAAVPTAHPTPKNLVLEVPAEPCIDPRLLKQQQTPANLKRVRQPVSPMPMSPVFRPAGSFSVAASPNKAAERYQQQSSSPVAEGTNHPHGKAQQDFFAVTAKPKPVPGRAAVIGSKGLRSPAASAGAAARRQSAAASVPSSGQAAAVPDKPSLPASSGGHIIAPALQAMASPSSLGKMPRHAGAQLGLRSKALAAATKPGMAAAAIKPKPAVPDAGKLLDTAGASASDSPGLPPAAPAAVPVSAAPALPATIPVGAMKSPSSTAGSAAVRPAAKANPTADDPPAHDNKAGGRSTLCGASRPAKAPAVPVPVHPQLPRPKAKEGPRRLSLQVAVGSLATMGPAAMPKVPEAGGTAQKAAGEAAADTEKHAGAAADAPRAPVCRPSKELLAVARAPAQAQAAEKEERRQRLVRRTSYAVPPPSIQARAPAAAATSPKVAATDPGKPAAPHANAGNTPLVAPDDVPTLSSNSSARAAAVYPAKATVGLVGTPRTRPLANPSLPDKNPERTTPHRTPHSAVQRAFGMPVTVGTSGGKAPVSSAPAAQAPSTKPAHNAQPGVVLKSGASANAGAPPPASGREAVPSSYPVKKPQLSSAPAPAVRKPGSPGPNGNRGPKVGPDVKQRRSSAVPPQPAAVLTTGTKQAAYPHAKSAAQKVALATKPAGVASLATAARAGNHPTISGVPRTVGVAPAPAAAKAASLPGKGSQVPPAPAAGISRRLLARNPAGQRAVPAGKTVPAVKRPAGPAVCTPSLVPASKRGRSSGSDKPASNTPESARAESVPASAPAQPKSFAYLLEDTPNNSMTVPAGSLGGFAFGGTPPAFGFPSFSPTGAQPQPLFAFQPTGSTQSSTPVFGAPAPGHQGVQGGVFQFSAGNMPGSAGGASAASGSIVIKSPEATDSPQGLPAGLVPEMSNSPPDLTPGVVAAGFRPVQPAAAQADSTDWLPRISVPEAILPLLSGRQQLGDKYGPKSRR